MRYLAREAPRAWSGAMYPCGMSGFIAPGHSDPARGCRDVSERLERAPDVLRLDLQ